MEPLSHFRVFWYFDSVWVISALFSLKHIYHKVGFYLTFYKRIFLSKVSKVQAKKIRKSPEGKLKTITLPQISFSQELFLFGYFFPVNSCLSCFIFPAGIDASSIMNSDFSIFFYIRFNFWRALRLISDSLSSVIGTCMCFLFAIKFENKSAKA